MTLGRKKPKTQVKNRTWGTLGDDAWEEETQDPGRKPNLDCIRAKAPFGTEYASVWRTEAIGRKEPSMILIGSDFHPSWQQICWLDTATGETGERTLEHAAGEAERF